MANWSTRPGVRIPGRRTPGKLTGTFCPKCGAPKVWKIDKAGPLGRVPHCYACGRTSERTRRIKRTLAEGREYIPANFGTTTPEQGKWTGTYCKNCGARKTWTLRDSGTRCTPLCIQCQRESTRRYKASAHGKIVVAKCAVITNIRRQRDPIRRQRNLNQNKEYRGTRRGQRALKRGKAQRKARLLEQLCPCCEGSNYWESIKDIYPSARCYCCGGKPDTLDHIIALACCSLFPGRKHPMFPSGLHCNKNLAPICNSCNSSKGSRIFPDLPEWEDWIHERHLWRRRQLYSERNN